MNYLRREEIFSKEYLTNHDLAEIFGVDASRGSTMLKNIKRKVGDRLNIQGKVHIQDYFEAFDLNPTDYRPSTSIVLAKSLIEATINECVKPVVIAQKPHAIDADTVGIDNLESPAENDGEVAYGA